MKRGPTWIEESERSGQPSTPGSVIDGPAPHLGSAIFAHALLRIASSADAILVGLVLAFLSGKDQGEVHIVHP